MHRNVIICEAPRLALASAYRYRWSLLIGAFVLSVIGSWIFAIFILPWPKHPMNMSLYGEMRISRLKLKAKRGYVGYGQKPLMVDVDKLDSSVAAAKRKILSLPNIIPDSQDEENLSNHTDSEDYSKTRSEPLSDDKCEVIPKNSHWMLSSFPTCNLFHEIDTPHFLMLEKTRVKGHGYWRDVWVLPDTCTRSFHKVALKTLRHEHDYTDQNYERHRRDALAHARLTSSPNIVDMYGYCGQSGLYQYSSDGTLSDRLEEHIMAVTEFDMMGKRSDDDDSNARRLVLYEKLQIAYQVASALADLHDIDAMRDSRGQITSAAIVHTDIKADQFISFDGHYKLNDFNRCRFMRRKTTTLKSDGDGEPCGFIFERNPSVYRSPEEYCFQEETEKIDIFSMGYIFYILLADVNPWDGMGEALVQQRIIAGERPELPKSKADSVNNVDVI